MRGEEGEGRGGVEWYIEAYKYNTSAIHQLHSIRAHAFICTYVCVYCLQSHHHYLQ